MQTGRTHTDIQVHSTRMIQVHFLSMQRSAQLYIPVGTSHFYEKRFTTIRHDRPEGPNSPSRQITVR